MHQVTFIHAIPIMAIFMASAVNGHFYVKSMSAKGDCLRPIGVNPPVNPINGLNDFLLTCGGGDVPAPSTCDVQAGSPINFQFVGKKEATRNITAHKGPCAVYLAKKDTPTKWTSVYNREYEQNQWCTDLIRPEGQLSVPLPKGLSSGQYVMRVEVNAFELAAGDAAKIESWVRCADINVVGGDGSAPLPEGITIPSNEHAQKMTSSFQKATPDSLKSTTPPATTPTTPDTGAPAAPPNGSPVVPPNASPSPPSNNPPSASPANPPQSPPANPPSTPPKTAPGAPTGNTQTIDGRQFPVCRGNAVTAVDSQNRQWGWENNASCLIVGRKKRLRRRMH